MKLKTVIYFVILINQIGICQKSPMKRYGVRYDSHRDSIYGYFQQGINKRTGDTITLSNRTRKFQVKSKNGIQIIDGQILGGMGTKCGCSPEAHGYWIEKYRTGILKEQGTYYCNEKIKTWVYYFKDGKISRIENFERPYSNVINSNNDGKVLNLNDIISLNNAAKRKGPFKEYYPNGNLKIEGTYEIVEAYSVIDTIPTFDPETYEKSFILKEGEFWNPKSIKIGVWNYYDETKRLTKSERYQYSDYENIRSITRRYQEIYAKLFDN